MKGKRVMIATGGTGGHIYPAEALAQQLKKVDPSTEILFIGGNLQKNQYFNQGAYKFREVPSATFAQTTPTQKLSAVLGIARGLKESRRAVKEFSPDVIVGFGSYYTLPVLLAGKISSIPLVLHEANSIPGQVNRFLSRYARVTGVNFSETASLLKGRVVDVGMPLREGYSLSCSSKEGARRYFNLSPTTFTFLVFGGSQGALVLNTLVCEALTEYLGKRGQDFQVIHLTGDQEIAGELSELYDSSRIRHYVQASESKMDLAWSAADMVISRAGASTISEQIEFEVPGILVPYPNSANNHQSKNAKLVASSIGGAVRLEEKDLDAESLARGIADLLADDYAALFDLKRAIRDYKGKKKRRDLCSLVCEVTGLKVR